MKNILISIFTAFTIFCSGSALGDEIYKWVDNDGITHYSTQKFDERARLADLPNLNKGEYKIGAVNGATCDKHGGINCQAGEDVDGSVICFDGFDGASARFTFHCNSPKLRITDVSEPDNRGKVSVFIRNDRSVTARLPKVIFTNKEGSKLPLKGPAEIQEFQMAEFTLHSGYLIQNRAKPDLSQFTVSCENCE